MDNEIKKDLASNWFKLLQNAICNDISRLEKNKLKFKSTSWQRSKDRDEGGGEYRILKNGKIFEKVGVNFSKVYGKFPKKFQKNILGAKLEIIEPCGFLLSDNRFKRVVMDYLDDKEIKFYKSSDHFFKSKDNQRIILMTTKASISYTKFKFEKNDTILFGRESAGVPEKIHKLIKNRLKIPMENNKRSLNLASSVAIILAECLKQTKWI